LCKEREQVSAVISDALKANRQETAEA